MDSSMTVPFWTKRRTFDFDLIQTGILRCGCIRFDARFFEPHNLDAAISSTFRRPALPRKKTHPEPACCVSKMPVPARFIVGRPG
jgi:hypothetical protein